MAVAVQPSGDDDIEAVGLAGKVVTVQVPLIDVDDTCWVEVGGVLVDRGDLAVRADEAGQVGGDLPPPAPISRTRWPG